MKRFTYMGSMAWTAALAASLLAAPLGAQAFKGGRGNDGVPEGHRPPPGMCRIWIDGVPPGQQPAPTDCATAVRNRPANGRVIFGDDAAKSGKGKPKKFRGVASSRGDYDGDRERASSRRGRDDVRDRRDRDDDTPGESSRERRGRGSDRAAPPEGRRRS